MSIDTVVPASGKSAYKNFHFSQAVKACGLLVCSGQIGTQPDHSVPETAEEEFRNAWKAVGIVLKEAGLGFEDIIEYTSYHVNLNQHIQAFMKIRDEVLSEPWPAWTAIGITELAVPGARVEIRVIARMG
ncbi:MAG: RidA family protein [Proteobacteria bacterium]|nr:RidA family protein [Pseudomonadota bacterium]MBU4470769.1 RidA family protein [Pseudomonadota bacterium]MCG2751503.1 RidA family protein [Desulfobacteraceae bacterium]